jgi:hypothetical protein
MRDYCSNTQVWDERFDVDRDWPGVMSNAHRFMNDSFPVHVAAPKSLRLSQKLYNGKYKRHVVKVPLFFLLSFLLYFIFIIVDVFLLITSCCIYYYFSVSTRKR